MEEYYNRLCDFAIELTRIDPRKTNRRDEDIVDVRYAIANILMKVFNLNTVQVGGLMNRDHSCVVRYRTHHSIRYRNREAYAVVYDAFTRFVSNEMVEDGLDEVIELVKLIGK